jgi:hypothetical protein
MIVSAIDSTQVQNGASRPLGLQFLVQRRGELYWNLRHTLRTPQGQG